MSSIYSRAELVLFWLDGFKDLTCGLGDEVDLPSGRRQSDSGLQQLQQFDSTREDSQQLQSLQQEAKDTKALVKYLGNYYSRCVCHDIATAECPVSDIPTSIKAWDHFLAILAHHYFERRWILQEISRNPSRVFVILEAELLLINSLNHSSLLIDTIRDGYCRDFAQLLPPEMLAKIASSWMDLSILSLS